MPYSHVLLIHANVRTSSLPCYCWRQCEHQGPLRLCSEAPIGRLDFAQLDLIYSDFRQKFGIDISLCCNDPNRSYVIFSVCKCVTNLVRSGNGDSFSMSKASVLLGVMQKAIFFQMTNIALSKTRFPRTESEKM